MTLTCLYYKEESKYLQTIFSPVSICNCFLPSPILSLSLSISFSNTGKLRVSYNIFSSWALLLQLIARCGKPHDLSYKSSHFKSPSRWSEERSLLFSSFSIWKNILIGLCFLSPAPLLLMHPIVVIVNVFIPIRPA